MEGLDNFNGYVKTEAEAIDNYSNSIMSSDAVESEDAQQLALEQATQDMDLACDSLKISPDPMVWSHEDVRRWLLWASEHYNIPDVNVELFCVDGLTLCGWNEDDFAMRNQESGEVINTLLDVWKSTGKLRRTNIFVPNPPASFAPMQHQQQQQFVKFEDMRSLHGSYPPQQFLPQQQQFNYSMSYAMPSPPPPPSYNSLMLNRQHQFNKPNTTQLFFNAGEPVSPTTSIMSTRNDNAMTPPSSAGSMHFLPPQNNMGMFSVKANHHHQQHQQQQQMYAPRTAMPSFTNGTFMGCNVMPTPSPANSSGNYDDCESLESYDMNAVASAAVAAAAAAAGAGVGGGSNANVVAQCLINTSSNSNAVVSSSTASNGQHVSATQQHAAFYDKYYGNPPGQANIHLWQFLKELLAKPELHATCIRWVDRTKGVFKIEDSVRVAKLWGKRKNRPAMNYDKLSRSIRQYYKKGIMKKTEKSQRLVYQFCHPYSC